MRRLIILCLAALCLAGPASNAEAQKRAKTRKTSASTAPAAEAQETEKPGVADQEPAWEAQEPESGGVESGETQQPETAAETRAEAQPPAGEGEKGAAEAPAPPQWFIGVMGRLNWVPPLFPELFLDDEPAVLGPGFELVATKRGGVGGFSVVFGLGYTSYQFEGPTRDKGDPPTDTEYLDSTLGLAHASASLLWSTDLVPETLAFEYGFGLDFGIVTGKLVRTEAYKDQNGNYKPCNGVHDPDYAYCEDTTPPGQKTNAYNERGAHYHVVEKRIPPVMAFPHIPHLALRYMPHPKVALKLEMAYGIVQFWFGLSAHYGIK